MKTLFSNLTKPSRLLSSTKIVKGESRGKSIRGSENFSREISEEMACQINLKIVIILRK